MKTLVDFLSHLHFQCLNNQLEDKQKASDQSDIETRNNFWARKKQTNDEINQCSNFDSQEELKKKLTKTTENNQTCKD